MRPFKHPFLFLFFLAFLISGNSFGNLPPDADKLIVRKWQYVRIHDITGKPVKQVGNNDFLVIVSTGSEKRFTYNLDKEGIKASGRWSIHGDELWLEYDPQVSVAKVDSMVLHTGEGNTEVDLYALGNKLGSIQSGQVLPERKVRKYKIRELTEQALQIEEDGITFKYQYQPPYTESNVSAGGIGRGILGLLVLVLILYLFSANRSKVPWKLVTAGISLQLIFAIGVLKIDLVKSAFETVGGFFVTVLSFTEEGSRFVFGDMINPAGSLGFVFAFQILPTIIFFSALTSLLFYLGILQKIVYAIAWLMSKTMKLSGAESLAAAGNIFIGQTEAPLLIKPYISSMTKSELLCLMTGGMATIAGGVMAAYIGFLGGDDPAMRLMFAKHLLAASVMSAPAAIVAAKILVPETADVNSDLKISKDRLGSNFLEALAVGTTDGLRLAVNVGAMLLVFIAMMAMANYILEDLIGNWTGLNGAIAAITGGRYDGLTLQFMLGYICAPLSWLMGVCSTDMVMVGQLIGEKTVLNEFVAYTTLGGMKSAGLFAEQKSIIIATYILCGFANFASIGIQIGGIGALAPDRRSELSKLGFRALLGGTIASLLTAVIVGMLI